MIPRDRRGDPEEPRGANPPKDVAQSGTMRRALSPIAALTLAAALATILAAGAGAQTGLVGRFSYPQFRGLSALPGGGFGVRPDGAASIDGAMAFSSPVAYALRPGGFVLAFSSISQDGRFRFQSRGSDLNVDANGTGAILYGTDLKVGRLTVADMIYSGQLDNGYNLHFSPNARDDYDEEHGGFRPLQFAFGVQDLFGDGGTSGDTNGADPALDAADRKSSTSVYVVATDALPHGVYVSAGVGSGRFRFGFGSVSAPLFRRARLAVEHDGFSVNAMLAYSPPLRIGPEGGTTLSLGLVRGRYATFAVALHF